MLHCAPPCLLDSSGACGSKISTPTILTEIARNHAASAYRGYFFGRGRPLYGLGQWNAFCPARDLTAARAEPRSRRAAEQRDEIAALRSITSSARASSVGGASLLSMPRRIQRSAHDDAGASLLYLRQSVHRSRQRPHAGR